MKKTLIIIILLAFSHIGFGQIKPLVVSNKIPVPILVYVNQTIENVGSRSSVATIKPGETHIMKINDINATLMVKTEKSLESLPIRNNAFQRHIKSPKGDCVVLTINQILETSYVFCGFKTGLLKEYIQN